MSASNLQARRATVDDLVALRKLWHRAGLPVERLEKQITEFQIVETPDGVLLGALGLALAGSQGRLHSEVYASEEFEGELRRRLWERVQAIARNHGLHRIWTREPAAAWAELGFEAAPRESLEKLPGSFGSSGETWQVLKLREEAPAAVSLEKEFEMFTAAQRESSERLIRQAQSFRNIAYAALGIVLVLGVLAIAYTFMPGARKTLRLKTPAPAATNNLPPATATNAPAPTR